MIFSAKISTTFSIPLASNIEKPSFEGFSILLRPRRESNPCMSVLQTEALPLRHLANSSRWRSFGLRPQVKCLPDNSPTSPPGQFLQMAKLRSKTSGEMSPRQFTYFATWPNRTRLTLSLFTAPTKQLCYYTAHVRVV